MTRTCGCGCADMPRSRSCWPAILRAATSRLPWRSACEHAARNRPPWWQSHHCCSWQCGPRRPIPTSSQTRCFRPGRSMRWSPSLRALPPATKPPAGVKKSTSRSNTSPPACPYPHPRLWGRSALARRTAGRGQVGGSGGSGRGSRLARPTARLPGGRADAARGDVQPAPDRRVHPPGDGLGLVR